MTEYPRRVPATIRSALMSTTVRVGGRHRSVAESARISSIDIVRGAVMVLMAIDHVRVYSGLPAGGPTAGIFFTRWVTHFCAPAFIFLAGASAFMYSRRHPDVSRFLVTRGLWLVLLELTLLRVAWTFNVEFGGYNMAGVIWVIGWCMVALAVLARLPLAAVGAFGVVIIAGHNVFDLIPGLGSTLGESSLSGLWKILYLGFSAGPIALGNDGPQLWVLYSLVPWVGVIAAGYAFGAVLLLEPERWRRICLALGIGSIAALVVLRGLNLYGDPRPWRSGLDVLNATKYPASLSFLLMTLGPTIAVMPLLDNARGAVTRWLTVFGRVPFFYYVLHIPLIHVLASVVSRIRMGEVSGWLFASHPMAPPPPPEGYTWSLPLLYLVWAIAVVMLHGACRWYAGLKARRSDWWMKFV
jgi:uncharacterized membrane protein